MTLGQGKSTPDQYSAHGKRKINYGIKAGLDATTPKSICECIKHNGGLANTILLTGTIVEKKFKMQKEIDSISKYHDFMFSTPKQSEEDGHSKSSSKNGILVRQQAQMGKYKVFMLLVYYISIHFQLPMPNSN